MTKWLDEYLAHPESQCCGRRVPSESAVSALSVPIPAHVQFFQEMKCAFNERAAIKEYDGKQDRITAEVSAIEEILPTLNSCGDLVLSLHSPPKYRWWSGGQSVLDTLRELGASEETLAKYTPIAGRPKPKTAKGED